MNVGCDLEPDGLDASVSVEAEEVTVACGQARDGGSMTSASRAVQQLVAGRRGLPFNDFVRLHQQRLGTARTAETHRLPSPLRAYVDQCVPAYAERRVLAHDCDLVLEAFVLGLSQRSAALTDEEAHAAIAALGEGIALHVAARRVRPLAGYAVLLAAAAGVLGRAEGATPLVAGGVLGGVALLGVLHCLRGRRNGSTPTRA
jgi:hypothetical protein